MHKVWIAVALAALGACSDSHRITIEEAPVALSRASCSYAFRCCDDAEIADELDVVDPARCEATIEMRLRAEIAERQAMIDSGRLVFDEANADECARQLEETPCGADPDDVRACGELFAPGLQVGDACDASEECASGLCVDDVCRAHKGRGEPCGFNAECADDDWCLGNPHGQSTTPGVCTRKPSIGEPCPDFVCGEGFCGAERTCMREEGRPDERADDDPPMCDGR